MSNKEKDKFSQGYACAVANLIRMYGDGTIASEVYRCNFLNENQLADAGADESDIEVLKSTIKDIERQRA